MASQISKFVEQMTEVVTPDDLNEFQISHWMALVEAAIQRMMNMSENSVDGLAHEHIPN